MSIYKHGIATVRSTDAEPKVTEAQSSIQVAIGTAPVNLVDDPAINKPVVCKTMADFRKSFGWSDDFDSYTLCQVAYESFSKYAVGPVVFINVLDPDKATHKSNVAAKSYPLVNGQATLDDLGIILSTVAVAEAVQGEDFVVSFDADGKVIFSVTSDGKLKSATTASISYSKLAPTAVSATDVIGGTDANNTRKGIDLIDEIYSTLGVVPGILLAPGYSHISSVAFALEAKAILAGSLTNAIAVIDIESSTTTTLAALPAAKGTLGAVTRWDVLCWPKAKVDGRTIWLSTAVAGLMQLIAAENNNIPGESPSNHNIQIDALCLADGTEKIYTMDQVNDYMNANGIVSAVYMGGWKAWGNNTAAYPGNTNPNDRFIKCVEMSNYLENRFKTEYLPRLDRNASPKQIAAIVTNFNATLNSLTPDYLASGEIIFNKEKSDFREGHIYFTTRYADYTPMEYIENEFIWDLNLLLAVIEEV